MVMPGFTAEASIFLATKQSDGAPFYRAQTSDPASAMPAAVISPATPQLAMRRIGFGVSYPPGDGCQICDCKCSPFPC
jgi:hypothetical protein